MSVPEAVQCTCMCLCLKFFSEAATETPDQWIDMQGLGLKKQTKVCNSCWPWIDMQGGRAEAQPLKSTAVSDCLTYLPPTKYSIQIFSSDPDDSYDPETTLGPL